MNGNLDRAVGLTVLALIITGLFTQAQTDGPFGPFEAVFGLIFLLLIFNTSNVLLSNLAEKIVLCLVAGGCMLYMTGVAVDWMISTASSFTWEYHNNSGWYFGKESDVTGDHWKLYEWVLVSIWLVYSVIAWALVSLAPPAQLVEEVGAE